MKQPSPFFSIIIPTYNRPQQLDTCLQSLAKLDYPRDRFEVIVVDDGSPVSPKATVDSFQVQVDISLHTQMHAGPAAARNTGAAYAKGDYLAFTDDDCAPARDWLKALSARLAAMPDCAIGGQTLNALPNNLYSTASQYLVAYLYTYYNAEPNQARFFASNNLALPAERFHALGGFNISFPHAAGEDREFCDRWLHLGHGMIYAPKAIVYHAHALTWRTFWRQHFNYGRAAFHFRQIRAQRAQERMQIEPLSFYTNLLRYPLYQAQNWQALSLVVLMLATQVANTIGFFWERMIPKSRLKNQIE